MAKASRSPKSVSHSGAKRDVAFIRKSGDQQEDDAQISNVTHMLKKRKVTIDQDLWFTTTVKRRLVTGDPEFKRLLDLIKEDRVRAIYLEAHDRLGITKRGEFFTFMDLLAEHEIQLIDLSKDRDLTAGGITTELMNLLGVHASQEELEKIAQRSLRSRVNNLKDRGTWPNGRQPFGFAKEVRDHNGKLLFQWFPSTRDSGQTFRPDASGKLKPGPANEPLPRKQRDPVTKMLPITRLIPTNNKEHIKTVRLVFDLFVKVGLSRRQISARMNAEGRKFYDKPFTHSLVDLMLRNPAYVGDTHFGKVQSGFYRSFEADGSIITVKRKKENVARDESDRVVKQNTHEGLITRKIWNLAVKKFQDAKEHVNFSPRNPKYYLKQIFRCGHCGKNLTGRTDTDHKTKKKTVYYVCSSYCQGRSSGLETACGYHRINHSDAEKLLLAKVAELNVDFDENSSDNARRSIERRMINLEYDDNEGYSQLCDWVKEGVEALTAYMKETFELSSKQLKDIGAIAHQFYHTGATTVYEAARDSKGKKTTRKVSLPVTLAQLKAAIKAAEAAEVDAAKAKIAQLEEKHRKLTLKWIDATDDMQPILRHEIVRIEAEKKNLDQRTIPLAKRLERLSDDDSERRVERAKLLQEWPALEAREKGESLRQIFETVTLYWEREFHPTPERPTRRLRTDRAGRWKYTLQTDKIGWKYGTVFSEARR